MLSALHFCPLANFFAPYIVFLKISLYFQKKMMD